MPWEGSSDSSASTLSHTMDEYIIQESVLHSQSADVEVACGQHAIDTAVAEKLALVARATRATCIFGISGVLIAMLVFAQFEGFSA